MAAEYAADVRGWMILNDGARPSFAQRQAILAETMVRVKNAGVY
jgi:hypothetical protein